MLLRKTVTLQWWILAVGSFVLLTLGWLIGVKIYPEKKLTEDFTIVRDNDESGLVRPLIGFDASSDPAPQYDTLRNRIVGVVAQLQAQKKIKTAAVYFRDLNSGRWTGINENDQFAPGSLMKVPLMVAYLKASEKNPVLLQNKIRYAGGDDLNALEYFRPTTSIKKGVTYTVEQLLHAMVVRSGNNSTYLLHQYIDKAFLQDIYNDLEIHTSENFQSDFLSPKAYSIVFRTLYNVTYLNAELSKKAIDLLVESNFKRGLKGGIPSGIPVANKYGESSVPNESGGVTLELHDCGIVYLPKNPVFICIMTKGSNFEDLAESIKTIATVVYNQVK